MQKKWILTLMLVVLCGMARAAFVTIGAVGNAADTNGYGAVSYTYQISATEVTIAEYQASGATGGSYWDDTTRHGGGGAPAAKISLYEAMKYCNWLTSGNVDNGAYVFSGGSYQSTDRASAVAAYGMVFALPTEDEWYKAAYYTGNSGDLWSLFANGTDTPPVHGTAAGWNYYSNGYVNSPPDYVWMPGYGGVEQNGTYDMMGNVFEWTVNPGGVILGGCYDNNVYTLSSSIRSFIDPAASSGAVGFRVVAIPEPATATMLALSGLVIAGYRRFFGRV
jgi:formylglycine-generating enzyme required for sulfatase activity